jgi:hypothetical protein
MNYKRYLASREWAIRKQKIHERSGGLCERCSTGKMENVHHLTYENICNEPLKDLISVCAKCHEFLSGKTFEDPATPTSRHNELDHFKIACIEDSKNWEDGLRAALCKGKQTSLIEGPHKFYWNVDGSVPYVHDLIEADGICYLLVDGHLGTSDNSYPQQDVSIKIQSLSGQWYSLDGHWFDSFNTTFFEVNSICNYTLVAIEPPLERDEDYYGGGKR